MTGGGEDDTDTWSGFAKGIYAQKIESWSDDKLLAIQNVIDEEITSRGDNVGGVRGRQEILDAIEEELQWLKEESKEPAVDTTWLTVRMETLDRLKEFVLGEVDDL